MNLDRENIQTVVSHLKHRISALEDQYRGFVKYCIDMIKCHRLMIDSELKNDPNTPRELLKQITMHGENLENSVKLASSSIKLQETLKLSAFETFKYEVLFLLNNSSSEHQKIERIETLLKDLEHFISAHYIKKDENVFEFIRSPDKKRTKTQKQKLKPADVEEITRLNSTISMLQQKISVLNQESAKKDESFQKVYEKLEQIQKLQQINTFNINSHCNSLQYSKNLSPDPKGYESMIMPDINTSSQSSMKQDDSFDSRAFYLIVRKKLLGLAEIIKKFTQQACFLGKFLEQNHELESFLHTFRADTEEIGKVIEDIVTPRFKDEVSDKRKEMNDTLGRIKKLKSEKNALNAEIKAKDAKIDQLKTVNENLNKDLKTYKGKVIANVKIIDNLHLQIEEANKDCRKMQEELLLVKENNQFLTVTRFNSGFSEKSSQNYSVRIEKNLEIFKCDQICIKNVYKNENLIRELRKMLKLKEKECADKDSLIKDSEKTLSSQEIQTETQEKTERPEFLSIKNRFSYEENLSLSKKLSAALIEKAKIDEKLQISEKFAASLEENAKLLQSEIKVLRLQLDLKALKTEEVLSRFSIVVTSRILIWPNRDSSREPLEKPWNLKIEDLTEEVQVLKSENSIILINLERTEREKNEQEMLSKISQEKLQIYARENEKLMNVLRKYEDESVRQESFISTLQKEKEILVAKVEETNLLSSRQAEKDSKNFRDCFNFLKKTFEKLLDCQKVVFEKTLKRFDSLISSQASRLAKLVKTCFNLAFKQKISAQLLESSIKSLSMRVEDRENSISTLTSSLKLAESTILSQNAKNSELEKEKEALLTARLSLMTEITSLNEQLRHKNTQLTSDKSDTISAHIEKFTDIIRTYETSKESLLQTIENQEKLIKSLQERIKSLHQDLQSTEQSCQTLQTNLKDSELELKNAKNSLESTQIELKKAKNDLNITENELKSTKFSLKITETDLLKVKTDLKTTENELKDLKQLNKSEEYSKRIEFLENKLKDYSCKENDDEVSQLKSVLQSQVQILDTECKRLEEKLRVSQSSKEKEVEALTKKLDSLAKQLVGLNLKNQELKTRIQDQDEWKKEQFDVVKTVKYKDSTWSLVETKLENRLFWTDQVIQTDTPDEFEELRLKYCKLKNYSFRLREEYKKLKRKMHVLKKEIDIDKKLVPMETNDELLEITSPFISPRDPDMQLLYDGLRSARSYGTDFDEDTFGELSSKIVKEGNSIFNASSFEEMNEDTDKINLLLEKMNCELKMKNEIIKNYEKTIVDLKSRENS